MMPATAIQFHDHGSTQALRWEHASHVHTLLSDSLAELTANITTQACPLFDGFNFFLLFFCKQCLR